MNGPLTLGFSPCPNDTFIFDALIHHKISDEGLLFDLLIEDVEQLNVQAKQGIPDVTKISFFAFASVADNYELLDAGSALGKNCGPLLISKKKIEDIHHSAPSLRIAIPGINTTANFLASHFLPGAKNKYACLFSEIEDEVLSGRADAGLIIHESRFTYEEKGLLKVADLGELWEEEMKCPLPLGGIAIKKNLPAELKQRVNTAIKASVEFALRHPGSSKDFVKSLSQEMDDKVIRQHIGLYVNEFSIDLGPTGKQSVSRFLEMVTGKADHKKWFLNPLL